MLYGCGQSNQAVKKYFDLKNIPYIIYDDFKKSDVDEIDFEEFEIVIKSPGISNDSSLMKKLKNKKKKIITDLDFFYQLKKDKLLIAITGTNGKTTTCQILGKLLKSEKFICCGNIGIPVMTFAEDDYPGYIIECSSYMLEYAYDFKPQIYVFLNIDNHHLAMHKTFSNYLEAKLTPLKNLNENDIIIFNQDDHILTRVLSNYKITKYSFSLTNQNANCYYDDQVIWLNQIPFVKTKNFKLREKHNIQNIMAAILTIKAIQNLKPISVNDQMIRSIISNFETLPHRLEIIYESKNLIIINDSKATNPFASVKALETMQTKYSNCNLYWIVGGFKEPHDFNCLNEFSNIITKAYLFGENQEELEQVLDCSKEKCLNFEEILLSIRNEMLKKAEKEDKLTVILFSPASSSYDMFENFEKRGEYFKKIALEIFTNKTPIH